MIKTIIYRRIIKLENEKFELDEIRECRSLLSAIINSKKPNLKIDSDDRFLLTIVKALLSENNRIMITIEDSKV